MLATIIVVSDTAANDNSTDKASDALRNTLETSKFEYSETLYVPDDIADIQNAVKSSKAATQGGLVLLTGGTGFAARDVTPEAVEPLLERKAPGIVHAMFAKSLEITPFACMSRGVAGVYSKAMVLTLPGKPKGAVENLEAVIEVLPHAVKLIGGDNSRRLHEKMDRHGENSNERDHGTSSNTHSHSHSQSHSHTHRHGHSHTHNHGHSHTHNHGPTFHKLVSNLSNDPAAPVSARARQSPYPMIPVPEAEQTILSKTPVPRKTTKNILEEDFVGCIIAEDVASHINVPAFPASIVDGYAVVHSDGPGEYSLSVVSHASPQGVVPVAPGTIARVTTGAPVPAGATAVVPVEETKVVSIDEESGEEKVVAILAEGVENGDNIRTVGSDVKKGDVVVPAGTLVTKNGGIVGLLASVGVLNVQVYDSPTVGVMSTGNELVDISLSQSEGKSLEGGEIWDSNRPSLLSMVRAWGFKAVDLGIVNDEPGVLETSMKNALERSGCDVLITTGGVSMGELDLIKPTIERQLNGTIEFGRISMKPGKPTTFATLPNGKLIFGLPGNPASATVTFHLFVLLALRKLSGFSEPHLPRLKVKLGHSIRLDPQRSEFHRVVVSIQPNGDLVANTTGGQRSSRIGSLSGANALLRLPTGGGSLEAGTTVEASLIEQLV